MKTSRRDFIKSTGYVAVGFSVLPNLVFSAEDCSNMSAVLQDKNINNWLQILEDGSVLVFTGKMELGQGIRIAIAQVAAEELNMDIDLVEVNLAETKVTPDEGYTAGSRSIAQSAMTVRRAAAAAANILLDTAAKKYDLEKSSLYLKDGQILSKNGQKNYSFFEILGGKQIETTIPAEIEVKLNDQRQIVGKPVPRKDINKMIKGEPVYVQDMRFPDMVHARVVRPPSYHAVLEDFRPENAEKLDSVIKIIRKNSFIGIFATDEYQAQKAKQLLEKDCKWSIPKKLPEPDSWKNHLKEIAKTSENVENTGSLNFEDSLKAVYSKPYVMHGSIGPSCAVAYFDGDKLQIWTHSQGVYPLQGAISDLLNLSENKMQLTGVPGSGCYGHNGADDVAAEAALLATEFPNKHIRLQWSRTDEHGWEPYGSAMLMELEASLDQHGLIQSWKYDMWSDTHSTRPGGNKANLLPTQYFEGSDIKLPSGYLGGGYRNSKPYYSIPNKQIDAHFFEGPLRVSALRSLGAYANIFAIESFMDELAEQAKKDPVAFRLMHLKDPRAIDILHKLREMTSNVNPAENEGFGIAFSRYKNTDSYFGVAVKVSQDQDEKISIKNMWGVIDSGEVINPDGLKNQTEGGMIQSASWTMKEEVKFNKIHVTSLDWDSYPIFRVADIPEVQVEIIDRPAEPPLGAGEAAQGATSAAITNAIYNMTGTRVRDLPVSKTFMV